MTKQKKTGLAAQSAAAGTNSHRPLLHFIAWFPPGVAAKRPLRSYRGQSLSEYFLQEEVQRYRRSDFFHESNQINPTSKVRFFVTLRDQNCRIGRNASRAEK